MDGRGGNETLHIRIVGDSDGAVRDVRATRREVRGLGDDVRRQDGVWRDHNGRLRDARGRFVGVGVAATEAGRQVDAAGRKADGASRRFRLTTLQAAGLQAALDRQRRTANELGNALRFASVAAAGMGAYGVSRAVRDGIRFNATMESGVLALKRYTGGAKQANKFTRELFQEAKRTPFEFTQLLDTSRRLLSFGADVDMTRRLVRSLGDAMAAAGADQEKMARASLALGQIQAKNRVYAEELLQLTEAGIPAYRLLQEQLGLTGKQVANIGEQGIDAETALNALADGMDRRFKGAAAEQARTWDGMMSTLRDNWAQTTGAMTEGLFVELKEWAPEVNTTMDRLARIFRRDDIDLGVKLQKSRVVVRRNLGPLADEIGEALRDADIPEKIGDGISAAVPVVAENAAELGFIAVKSLVRAFNESDGWGKLVIGGVAMNKLGGFAALRKLLSARGGGGLGGALGGGKVPGVPKGVTPVWVVNQGPGGPGGAGKPGSKPPPVVAGGARALSVAGRALPLISAGSIIAWVVSNNNENFQSRAGTSGPTRRAAEGRPQPGTGLPGADWLRNGRGAAVWAREVKRRTEEVSQAYERTGQVQTRVLSRAERDLASLRMQTARETQRIKERMGTDTREGREALARNFREAADAAKRQMDRSGRVTREGLKLIRDMMVAELKVYGLSGSQALNILKGDGQGGTYGDPDNNRGREGGAFRAAGGFIGRPGEAGRDTVPVMVGRGEAVLNRHQQGVVNAALGAVGIGGLGDLFSRVDRPHYMARGGYAGVSGDTDFVPGLGRALAAMATRTGTPIYVQDGRRTMAEQQALVDRLGLWSPTNPGAAAPDANAPHIRGIAADITPGRERFGGVAGRFGLGFPVGNEPWHVELLNAAAAGSAAARRKLRRIMVGGAPSPLRAVVQGALDRTGRAAQRSLDSFVLPLPQAPPAGGGAAGGEDDVALMRRIAAKNGWSFADWWEIDRRETGHGSDLYNESSGAALRGQFMPGLTQGRYGPGSDPGASPTMAQQIWAMARYIKERYGNPTAALAFHDANGWYARGGMVGAARGYGFGSPSRIDPFGRWASRQRRTPTDRSPYAQPTDVLGSFLSGIQERFQARRILAELNNREGDPSLMQDDVALAREMVGAWTSWLGVAQMNNSLSGIITAGGELQSARSWLADLTRTDAPSVSPQDSERASILATLLAQSQQDFRVSQAQFKTLANFPRSMVPFVGSFADGGTVDQTGLAYVHKGETITPPDRAPVVQLVMNADMAALWRAADGRIDQRIRGAQGDIEYRAARNRQRQATGPGGRR